MRPHGRARVNSQSPEGFGVCDRCGAWYNLIDLSWQFQWAGTHLQNLRILVCQPCIDIPQEQLRTIILPPDPPPLLNARVPDFEFEEYTPLIFQFAGPGEPPWGAGPATIMCEQTGTIPLIMQYTTSS